MTIKRGVLRDFDGGDYTATVEMAGSISVWLTGVPVARNIDGADMVPGRRVALLVFDPFNPNDAVIAAVWT